jgi:hypothetical protein
MADRRNSFVTLIRWIETEKKEFGLRLGCSFPFFVQRAGVRWGGRRGKGGAAFKFRVGCCTSGSSRTPSLCALPLSDRVAVDNERMACKLVAGAQINTVQLTCGPLFNENLERRGVISFDVFVGVFVTWHAPPSPLSSVD